MSISNPFQPPQQYNFDGTINPAWVAWSQQNAWQNQGFNPYMGQSGTAMGSGGWQQANLPFGQQYAGQAGQQTNGVKYPIVFLYSEHTTWRIGVAKAPGESEWVDVDETLTVAELRALMDLLRAS